MKFYTTNYRNIIASEYAEQCAFVEWLRNKRIRFCHVPNQGMFPVQYRAKLARMGLQKGFPDLMILDSPPQYPTVKGVAIEMKRTKGGSVSTEQKEWIDKLVDLGWMAMVCRGADEAIKRLTEAGY
jgi:hypothetical protein